jgi:hypothetical protein
MGLLLQDLDDKPESLDDFMSVSCRIEMDFFFSLFDPMIQPIVFHEKI